VSIAGVDVVRNDCRFAGREDVEFAGTSGNAERHNKYSVCLIYSVLNVLWKILEGFRTAACVHFIDITRCLAGSLFMARDKVAAGEIELVAEFPREFFHPFHTFDFRIEFSVRPSRHTYRLFLGNPSHKIFMKKIPGSGEMGSRVT
jgi:hypothetical protein